MGSIIQGQISAHMVKLAKNRSGNFVVQRVLDCSDESEARHLLVRLACYHHDLFDIACSRGGSRLLLEAVDREDEWNEAVAVLRAKLTEIFPRICGSKYGRRVARAFGIELSSKDFVREYSFDSLHFSQRGHSDAPNIDDPDICTGFGR